MLGLSKRTSTHTGLTKLLASPGDLWLALVAGSLPPRAGGAAFNRGIGILSKVTAEEEKLE